MTSRCIFQIANFLSNCGRKFVKKLNFAFWCILQEGDENVRAELEQTVWIPLLLRQGGSSPGNVHACVQVCVHCECVRGNHHR